MKRKLALASASSLFLAVGLGLGAAACGGAEPPPPEAPTPPAAPEAPATPAAPAAPSAAAPLPAAPAPPAQPTQAAPALSVKDVGFSTPESVLYDADSDVYLVSNINGSPSAKDNNGFISKVSPEGKLLELKWIEGGQKGAKLDAPKGMAVSGDTLYVADISVVRMFDRKTGKARGEVKLAGATFVNDLYAEGGKVYATDSGINITDKGPQPTKTDGVWVIEKGKAKSVAKGEDLGRPNGLFGTKDGVWVVTYGTNELYRVDEKGKRQEIQKLPKGALDGLVVVGDGIYVSSWEGNAVYKGKLGGSFEPAIVGVRSPADIGFDSKRNRVLVPLFSDNAIEAYDVK